MARIADVLGYSSRERRDLRRAALLHDIGKLGVSNLILDVCEALTAERPYRAALPPDQVRAIMWRDAGRALCPEALDALAATQELGVLTLATPATAAARPVDR